MSVERIKAPEKYLLAFSFTLNEDTSSKTVGLYLVGRSGAATLVGSASGVAEDTAFSINCDLSTTGIRPGASYRVNLVADVGGANPTTFIPGATYSEYWVDIYEVDAISDPA